ncbi:unnamed protein product [Rotaria sp. Silwood1]|nr:unnamed protein product [Rotaria sp. Silwood1]
MNEKIYELDQRCLQKLDEQQTQLNQIRHIDLTTLAICHIQDGIKTIENTRLQLEIRPLTIDDGLVFIEEFEPNKCNLVNLTIPYRTIDYSGEWGPVLANNNRYLFIDRHPNLCLINQKLEIIKKSPWKFDFIRGICWSSTLNCFIVKTRTREIYLINEKTLATELVQTIEEQDWSSCTCSDTSFYLTARREGTNIFEFNLLSSFALIKQWKPPHSCKHYEVMLNTAYKNKTLALVISHSTTSIVHLELDSSITLDRLWLLDLNISHTIGQPLIRCSSLTCDEWIVVDNNTSQLLHVKKDGQIKSVYPCNPSPWNTVLFGSNLLAIRARNSVNFYKLQSKKSFLVLFYLIFNI